MNHAQQLLEAVLRRAHPEQHAPLVSGGDEQLVAAVTGPNWRAQQLRLRSERWRTDQPRVLATLWWYSTSAWLVGPNLTSLTMSGRVFSADLDDLTLHWLADSRITERHGPGWSRRPRRSTAQPAAFTGSTSMCFQPSLSLPVSRSVLSWRSPPTRSQPVCWPLGAPSERSIASPRCSPRSRTPSVTPCHPLDMHASGREQMTLRTSCCLLYPIEVQPLPETTSATMIIRRRARGPVGYAAGNHLSVVHRGAPTPTQSRVRWWSCDRGGFRPGDQVCGDSCMLGPAMVSREAPIRCSTNRFPSPARAKRDVSVISSG